MTQIPVIKFRLTVIYLLFAMTSFQGPCKDRQTDKRSEETHVGFGGGTAAVVVSSGVRWCQSAYKCQHPREHHRTSAFKSPSTPHYLVWFVFRLHREFSINILVALLSLKTIPCSIYLGETSRTWEKHKSVPPGEIQARKKFYKTGLTHFFFPPCQTTVA